MRVIIVNEKAGDAPEGQSRADVLREAVEAAGLEARIAAPREGEGLDDVARREIEGGAETLIAAGGDGTIAALAGPCFETGTRLGVIPQGTFNYFARAYDIPQDIDGAIALLAEDPTREAPLGTVNGRVFLNNASIGVYPAILQTREDVYDRLGRSRVAAYWSVLKTLANKPKTLTLTVELDGKTDTIRTPLAFVAASAYQLEEFHLDGAAALEDGRFAFFTAPRLSRNGLLRTAWRMARGKARKGPDFQMRTASEITIRPHSADVLVACDGEKIRMRTPLVIRHTPRPLQLVAHPD